MEGGGELMSSFELSQEGQVLQKSNKCKQGGSGCPNFGHFVRT